MRNQTTACSHFWKFLKQNCTFLKEEKKGAILFKLISIVYMETILFVFFDFFHYIVLTEFNWSFTYSNQIIRIL